MRCGVASSARGVNVKNRKRTAQFLLCLLMVTVLPSTRCWVLAQTTNTKKSSTHVVLLGTGSPFPDPDRSGPATAIVVNDSAYLVDLGRELCVARKLR